MSKISGVLAAVAASLVVSCITWAACAWLERFQESSSGGYTEAQYAIAIAVTALYALAAIVCIELFWRVAAKRFGKSFAICISITIAWLSVVLIAFFPPEFLGQMTKEAAQMLSYLVMFGGVAAFASFLDALQSKVVMNGQENDEGLEDSAKKRRFSF